MDNGIAAAPARVAPLRRRRIDPLPYVMVAPAVVAVLALALGIT